LHSTSRHFEVRSYRSSRPVASLPTDARYRGGNDHWPPRSLLRDGPLSSPPRRRTATRRHPRVLLPTTTAPSPLGPYSPAPLTSSSR